MGWGVCRWAWGRLLFRLAELGGRDRGVIVFSQSASLVVELILAIVMPFPGYRLEIHWQRNVIFSEIRAKPFPKLEMSRRSLSRTSNLDNNGICYRKKMAILQYELQNCISLLPIFRK